MRRLLVDASVFITLTEIDRVDLLAAFEGTATVPSAVADEIRTEPAASVLEDAVSEGWLRRGPVETDTALERDGEWTEPTRKAAAHLGTDDSTDDWHGDVALLARALKTDGEVVVITDDKPLRKTCKALGVPVSGSIGVVIAAVERCDLDPEETKGALVAMDEVGARLSARLFRCAERLIDEAAED
jgi:predicted nucleic acid-binding protein